MQPDGYVNPRGTASLYVQGMTVPEAIEAFKKPYSKILHEPLIDLDLTDFKNPCSSSPARWETRPVRIA